MSNWETEKVHEIWNNSTGEHFEVGNDRDGLDMVEIRSYPGGDGGLHPEARLCMPREVAVEAARIITEEYGKPTEATQATPDEDEACINLYEAVKDWVRRTGLRRLLLTDGDCWIADENA